MPVRRPFVFAHAELEDRVVPAINILFDFRFDDLGFFTDNPDRITTLRAAAAEVGALFTDELSSIPFPSSPNDSWVAVFDRPGGVGQEEKVVNLLVPENSIVVFVGARELFGDKTEESSGREVYGSAEWTDIVLGRGQENSFGLEATDYSPWGGSITYDLIADWHFGLEPPGNPDEFDLYMATQKALFHILGFGSSEAWNRLGGTGDFFGPKAVEIYGTTIPLTDGNYEWEEDVLSQGQRTLMDAELEDGERIEPTALDLAAMEDIGWVLQGTSPPPPPPPAAPRPPVLPPAPIPPGRPLHVVGTDVGTSAQFTLNDAATFIQLAAFNPYAGFGSGNEFTGGIRAVTADINQDGIEDVITGPGPGIPTEIRVYSGANFPVSPETSLLASGYAFETSFIGGVFLAVGDVNQDGVPDVAISPDQGGGPRVRIVSGKDRTMLADFFGIEDPNFRGGARTALGDFNGDGNVDLAVAAGFGGGPRVALFDGASLRPGSTPVKLVSDFFVFEPTLRNGAYVAAGDINGDGFGDLIAGGGPGGGPRVYGLSGQGLTQQNGAIVEVANFFAGDVENRGGVRLATKNIDGDNRADIVAGAGVGVQSVVTTYLGTTIAPGITPPAYHQYLVFEPEYLGGVYVG
jgi:hypothetical protein